MILGVPCVASNVGGISDMLTHNQEGFLYQADAAYMLAYYVCELFGNDVLAHTFSKNTRVKALRTHDQNVNLRALLAIYNEIVKRELIVYPTLESRELVEQ